MLAIVLAIVLLRRFNGARFIMSSAGGIGAARDATEAFITDLEDGDTDGAYARLCADTQST